MSWGGGGLLDMDVGGGTGGKGCVGYPMTGATGVWAPFIRLCDDVFMTKGAPMLDGAIMGPIGVIVGTIPF